MIIKQLTFASLFSIAVLTPQYFYAQRAKIEPVDTSESETEESPDTYLSFGTSYDSKVVFQGRTDGIAQFGLSPNLSFQHKSGFNASVSGDVWSAETRPYARTTVGLGWDFDLSDAWSIGVGYGRWILHNGTAEEKSSLVNNFNLNFGYSAGTWLFSVAPSLTTGTSQAISTNISVTKIFIISNIFGSNDKILFLPNIDATIATDTRFSVNKLLNGKKNTTSKTVFRPAAYELSLPIKYKQTGKWSVGATFHYAIPVNATRDEGKLENVAYFSLDFDVFLWQKK